MSNYLLQSPSSPIQLGCILKIDKVPKATPVPTTIAKFNFAVYRCYMEFTTSIGYRNAIYIYMFNF